MQTGNLSSPSSTPAGILTVGSIAPDQIQLCDFRTVGGIDKARLTPIIEATGAAARGLTQSLQDKLGLSCETTLQSSDQIPCQAFLQRAGNAYLLSLQLGSQSEMALLQIDPMLLFPVMDRLLGGSGGPSELSREVTEIEDHIVKDFVRLICQELQTAWQAFKVPVSAGKRQLPAELQKVFSAKDNGLLFNFSVDLQSAGGGFQLLLPVASLGCFLAAKAATTQGFSPQGTISSKLAVKALEWTFDLQLILPGCKVQAAQLLKLSVGKILQLGVPVQTAGVLKIGGHDAFEAVPVRNGQNRGAQLLERLSQSQQETENTL